MNENSHFARVESWEAAEEWVDFQPVRPRDTAGFELQSLEVYVRDHKKRELPVGGRSLEAHYGGFVFSQSRKQGGRARRAALAERYGTAPYSVRVGGHEGRACELGPEVPPDDIDGRSPAVVVWHDGDGFFLVASSELTADVLLGIAQSIYAPEPPDEKAAARTGSAEEERTDVSPAKPL